MCKHGHAASKLFAAIAFALLALASLTSPAGAGPKRDAALQDCKNIYDDQAKHCIGSSNYAACMTMVTDKYESCRADADTIVGLSTGGGQPKPPRVATHKLGSLPNASQQ